ncbi:MAG: DnaJ domain-containing protein, partial [Acidobacteria bacterium]|nr:DnaJ domain-containing protein [Acidobacteriota bacterium]
MPKDYYAILGVQKNATEDEIKKSFRRLAHEHHPDKGGDPQKFKDVNEAFQVLGDKEKRAKYDRFGSAAFEQGGFGGAHGFSGFDGFNINVEDFGDFGDVFSEMFGFGGRGRK